MKKLLLLFIAVIQLTVSFGQKIKYQKTFGETLAQASKNNKPVFILLTIARRPLPDSILKRINFSSGFDSKTVADFYNKKFVSYSADFADSGAVKIRQLFHPTIFPCYIFLDDKGQIVYKAGGNYQAPEKYIDITKEALNRIASGNTISKFEKLDKTGELNRDQLKSYITLKEEFDLFDNAELVEKYIKLLTIGELDDYNQVLFILKAGPYAYGKAYNLAYTNRKIVDSIYKKEPLELRKAINNHIIVNTRNQAITTKNSAMAQSVASFVRGTWSNNYKEGAKSSSNELLNYYKAVKDTNDYYIQASYYYDNYYLNISADSAKKLQAKAVKEMKEAVKNNKNHPEVLIKPKTDNRAVVTRMVSLPQNAEVANTLNNAAWDFYTLGTHNSNFLFKALIWSRRAIELQPVYGYYDTMAHIMYRLNFYDEAQLNQQKAIEMAVNTPMLPQKQIDHLKDELGKMKDRKL